MFLNVIQHFNLTSIVSLRKRFDNAEKEYVASKLEYFQAKEKKELLSEHLCTIIHHNETRKALRLKTLMSDLHLEDTGSEAIVAPSPTHTTTNNNIPVIDPIPLGTSMISIQRLD